MLKLLLADLKMLRRNKQALFWALMFPLLFTFMFGFFFGSNNTVGTIAILNHSNSAIANNLVKSVTDSGLFKISSGVSDENNAKDLITNGKIGAALVIPENFGNLTANAPTKITVIDDPSNAQTNSALIGFLNSYMTSVTFQINHIAGPMFGIDEQKTNNKTLSYFDFVLAGILGLALMNSSIIGIAVSMSKYREDKILKRITTTPVKTWWFIVDEVLSRLVVNVIQVSLILWIGIGYFHAHIYGSIPVLYLLALLGSILFQLLGFVLASFTKTTDAAQGAATAITIPMMFLGGVFFPIDTLPHWLYSVVQYLPIAPLLRVIRSFALDGISPFSNPTNLVIVFIWIAACLIVSSWKFRLSDE